MSSDSRQPPTAGPDIDPDVWPLLDQYLAGTADAVDRAKVETWLASRADGEAIAAAFRRAGEADPTPPERWDVDESWARSRHRLRSKHQRTFVFSAMTRSRTVWRSTGALVAALIVVAALVVGSHLSRPSGERTFATGPGQQLRIVLSDGTRVTLGPASRLRLHAAFDVKDRTVSLEGEGFFGVVHNAEHPFAVEAGRLTVRDVGTAFDVRAYASDDRPRVLVTEGNVVVSSNGCHASDCAADLHAGDLAELTGAGLATRHIPAVDPWLVWRQGGLSFEDTPLKAVVRDISRTFGVTITLADSTLATRPVTGTFVNKPLNVILDVVSEVVGARYERKGQSIVIRAGPPTRRDAAHRSGPPPLTTARANVINE